MKPLVGWCLEWRRSARARKGMRRWKYGGGAVTRRLVCPNVQNHSDAEDVFAVVLPGADDAVLIYPNGECTNRWADGTVGVPREYAEAVEQSASQIGGAFCPHCTAPASWQTLEEVAP